MGMNNIVNEFRGDLKLSSLVLLGEKHDFLPHHRNNVTIQDLLIEKAYKNNLDYNLALEHGDFKLNGSNDKIYQILKDSYSDSFVQFLEPLLLGVNKLDMHNGYRNNAKVHLIGHHDGTNLEHNQKMAEHLNNVVSPDSITLAIVGQRHLCFNGSVHAAIQSYIKPGINTLAILQSNDYGTDLVSKFERDHPKSPKYILGIK